MSPIDFSGDKEPLENARNTRSNIRIVYNTGTIMVNKMGDLEGYGAVWYQTESIPNSFSLFNIQHKFRATHDSIYMVTSSSPIKSMVALGLLIQPPRYILGSTLVQTVRGNKTNFTKQYINKAEDTRHIKIIMEGTSDRTFVLIFEGNLLRNCPPRADGI